MSWSAWPTAGPPLQGVVAAPAMQATVLSGPINSAPAVLPPATAGAMPAGMQYSPEQWAQMQQQNWQQWAQWQQQYQQWHQQYGAEYQKSINALAVTAPVPAPSTNTAVPPPPPNENKPPPPPPPDDVAQSPQLGQYNTMPPKIGGGYTTAPPTNQQYTTGPPPNFRPPPQPQTQSTQHQWQNANNKRPLAQSEESDGGKRQMLDNQGQWNKATPPPKVTGQQWQSQPPPSAQTHAQKVLNLEELTVAEQKFDKEFAAWEAQFNKWKDQNVNHPDKTQYREYEKKWESWRNSLLERREQMRKKRVALQASMVTTAPPPSKPPPPAVQPQQSFNQPPPAQQAAYPNQKSQQPSADIFSKPPPNQNNEPLAFKPPKGFPGEETHEQEDGTDFLKSSPSASGGIPGLDLVKEDPNQDLPEDEPDESVAENPETPAVAKGPDLDAISKGINTILGDSKLMNMLSMVSQNPSFSARDAVNTQPKPLDQPPPSHQPAPKSNPSIPSLLSIPLKRPSLDQSNQNYEDYPDQYGSGQREAVNNFDDQTRMSFSNGPNDQDIEYGNNFSAPPPLIGRSGRNDSFNQGDNRNNFSESFNDNRRDKFDNSEGSQGNRPGFNQNRNNDNQGGGFNKGFNRNDDNQGGGFNKGFNRNDDNQGGGFNKGFNRNDDNQGGGFNKGFNRNDDNQGGGFNKGFNRNDDNQGGGFNKGFNRNDDNQGGGFNKGFNQNDNNQGGGFNKGFNRNDGFNSQRDNFSNPRDNFKNPRGNFNDQPDNFNDQRDNFNDQRDNFNDQRDNFNDQRDNFNNPRDNFNSRGGNFGRNNDYDNYADDYGDQFNENYDDYDPEYDDRDYSNQRGFQNQKGFGDDYNEERWNEDDEYDKYHDMFNDGDQVPEPPHITAPVAGPVVPPPMLPPEEVVPPVEEEPLFVPKVVVDYEHKSLKEAEPEVSLDPIYMFDYRHKQVNRIPYPQRPIWLQSTLRNTRQFDPLGAGRFSGTERQFDPLGVGVAKFSRDPVKFSRDPNRDKDRYAQEGRFDRDMRSVVEDRGPRPNDNKYKDYRNRYDDSRFERRQDRGATEYSRDRERNRHDNSPPRNREREVRDRDRDFGDKSRNRRSQDRNDRSRNEKKLDLEELSDDDWDDNAIKKPDNKDLLRFSPPRRNLDKRSPELVLAANPSNPAINVPVNQNITLEDLIQAPGRYKRPPRIVIILRGPPGSGKTYLARLIKDREMDNGGSAPRILSLDDYFMVEQEKDIVEDGKPVRIKEMVYEYEAEMEESYRQSLAKAFKKTVTDGYFNFIVVDNVNQKVKYFGEMWSYAKQNGFQVYICQLDLDPQLCTRRNIHNRSQSDIEDCIAGWEPTPSHHPLVDATNFLQSSGPITEVEMEEVDQPREDKDDAAEDHVRSKWDTFDCSMNNLARLDGVNKPLRPSRTMEEYLQLDDEWEEPSEPTKPGQKRVRWADLEEQKQQKKIKAIGFVVGQTDWKRMTDTSYGQKALTQTKYIERVRRS